jgi:hypothetical protein
MLARINEANLKKLQEEYECNREDVVPEVASEEEEDEEEEEEGEGDVPTPPALVEVQSNSSVVLRI